MFLKKIPRYVVIIISMATGFAIGMATTDVYFLVSATADAFIMLLQMPALPYISLSLIVGVGSLSPEKARSASFQILSVLFLLLLVMLFFILLSPIAFPDWKNADFYNASTIKASTEFDFVKLFIPVNPFHSLANAVIPSVVVFSLFVGVGLMGLKGKKRTLLVLGNLQTAVARVSSIVMKFAPIGVFCIAMRAAATVDSSQVNGLIVYIVTAAVLVILLTFLVLPAITAVITPFTYRQIMRVSGSAMATSFATGSFFSVIPIIVEKSKKLIEEISEQNSDANFVPVITVPVIYSLPIGGKLLALLFTLFAAWFTGTYVSVSDYSNLLASGIPHLFGTSTMAMPRLLEIFNVPESMFDVFLVAENLAVSRFAALLSVISASCMPLIIAASVIKKLTFKWRSFARYLLIILTLSVLSLFSLRYIFDAISHQYEGYNRFVERDFLITDVKTRILEEPEQAKTGNYAIPDVLKRIKQRGFIRVGYYRDDLPYSFHNNDGKLVGFDIEIMNLLAVDLGVTVEFVKIYRSQAAPLLESGYLDITSGVPVIPDNMKAFTLTIPYSTQSIAFVVKEERRAEFTDWLKTVDRKDLIVGIPESFFYRDALERGFRNTKAWEISSPRLFFREEYKHIDAMLFGAASASAWTLLYPEYTVITPRPIRPPLSMAFPIGRVDPAFEVFMRNWINMRIQNKSIEKLFNYWIEGKNVSKDLIGF